MSVSLICLRGSERAEVVGGGQSWVRGVMLESDGRGLRSGHSEDES